MLVKLLPVIVKPEELVKNDTALYSQFEGKLENGAVLAVCRRIRQLVVHAYVLLKASCP